MTKEQRRLIDKRYRESPHGKEHIRLYRLANKERIRRVNRLYEITHREQLRKAKNEWCARNKDRRRGYKFKWRYGITLGDYNRLLAKQDGACAACGERPENERLHLDHAHLTGQVRGLLCGRCNRVLGMLKDNPFLCDLLKRYLEAWASVTDLEAPFGKTVEIKLSE